MAIQDFKVKNGVVVAGDVEVGTSVVKATTPETAVSLFAASTGDVSLATAKTSGNITIGGAGSTTIVSNLTVNGVTTTINSTTIAVDDKNIELGTVDVPTDTTADGGGLTLKGATDKTIIWDNANDNWTSNQHWNISTGLSYKINNVVVLDSTILYVNKLKASSTAGPIYYSDAAGTYTSEAQLQPQRGGTGLNGVTNVGELYAGSSASTMTRIAPVAAGSVLTSNGTAANPVWSATPAITTSLTVPLIQGTSGAGGTVTIRGGTDTAGTVALNAATVNSSNASLTLFATPTTIGAYAAATSLTIGGAAGAQTISIGSSSTAASTYNLGTGAVASATKTVNLGTTIGASGVSNVNIGATTGTTTVLSATTTITSATSINLNSGTIDDSTATVGLLATPTTLTVGYQGTGTATTTLSGGATANTFTRTTNISNGVTASGGTNTINVATASAAGGVTNVNIGSALGTSTTTIAGVTQLTSGSTKVGNTTLTQGGTVTVTFPTLAGTLVGSGDANTVSNAMIRQSAGLSVVGRSANSTGNVADIVGTDGQVLRVSGTALGFGTVANAGLTNSSVTIGSTAVSLGATVTTFAGLVSVTSTGFTGDLTGNATTATSIAGGAANQLHYQTGVGTTGFVTAANYGVVTTGATGTPAVTVGATGVLQGAAASIPVWTTTPTLSGTNFTGIPNGALTNSSVTIGSTSVALGATVTTFAGLVSVTSTGFTGALTGNASTATALATTRAIYGNNFDGSAALAQVIASTYGGTGNGFTKFSGPTTAEKTFTLPDASATLLYSGGALGTPSSGTLTNCTFPTLNQNTTGTATKAINLTGGNGTTLLGSIPYQSGTDTTAQLAPNTTATRKFLRQTGTGTNGAAPAWDTVTATDVGLGNVTNESKATMFTSPTFTGTVSGVTATHVGLGNVTNESKATMFTSSTFTGTTLTFTGATMSFSGAVSTYGAVTVKGAKGTWAGINFQDGSAVNCSTFMTRSSDGYHGVYNKADTTWMWFSDGSSNFTSAANVTAYSDERRKKNWRPVTDNFIEKLSLVKTGIYDRTDIEITQVGVSAQSLQEVLPEAVLTGEDGMLSVAYGNAALAACVELAKEVVELRKRLAILEAR